VCPSGVKNKYPLASSPQCGQIEIIDLFGIFGTPPSLARISHLDSARLNTMLESVDKRLSVVESALLDNLRVFVMSFENGFDITPMSIG